jgi:Flp pilus assembly protein TadG
MSSGEKQPFVRDRRGNMAVMGIFLMLGFGLVTGGVVDATSLFLQKRDVQAAADAAALAAARELIVANGSEGRMEGIATAIAEGNLGGAYRNVATKATALSDSTIEVEVSTAPRVFFPGPVALNAKLVSATAVGEVAGGGSVCMIGLDTKVKHTLWMQKKASITAVGCAIYSNSLAPDGILIEDKAEVNAQFICSAGGVKTAKAMALDPEPVEDCPPIEDPLASRPPPAVGGCDFNKKKIEEGETVTLSPATYCGGLEIKGNVTLEPGVYIIKNGPLKIKDNGSLTGEHVGFFLTGKDALLNFEKESSIRLSAPKAGPLAGLLVYEDRKVKPADEEPAVLDYDGMLKAQEHRIRSQDAPELVGTIYISRNRLLISGDDKIAAESAYTVIIAREFALAEGPQMVLNTDYASTDVPVPEGVGNRSTTTRPRLIH